MAKLWRRPREDEDKTNQIHEVDLPALRVDRPSIIFLNGFFTQDHTPQYIRASIRNMEELMANRPGEKTPVEVYAWSHHGLSDLFNVAAYSVFPNGRACRAARQLAAGLILPLAVKDLKIGADGKASGTPLPLEEVKKNLRNITFFGYSAGTITAQECFNASLQMMQQAGFSEKDAREALHEVVCISVGTMSRPAQEKDRFTTLFLEATNDKIVEIKNRLWSPLRVLFARVANRLKIEPLSESSAIITAAVSKKNWESRVRDGKTVRERIRSLLPKWTMMKSYHELPRYVTQDEDLSPFAKMVHYALANAAARTERLDPLKLLEPPAGVDDATALAYRGKIAKAYRPKPKR